MEKLTWAERAALLLCALFLCAAAFLRLRGGGETPLTAEKRMHEEPAVSGPVHYEDGRLDLNTATAEELTALPGIGEVLAGRIVALREEKGGFTCLEELCEVRGIGGESLKTLSDYLTLEGQDEDPGR